MCVVIYTREPIHPYIHRTLLDRIDETKFMLNNNKNLEKI